MKPLLLLVVLAMFVMWVVPVLMKAGKKRVLIMLVLAVFLLWAGAARVADEVVIQEIPSEVSVTKSKANTNLSPHLVKISYSSKTD